MLLPESGFLVGRLVARGATCVAWTDRTGEARHFAHEIGVWLRRRSDQAKAEVLAITGQLAALAKRTVAEAALLVGANTGEPGSIARLRGRLALLLERARVVISQAETRVAGGQPDGDLLLPAIARLQANDFGVPHTVVADRGYCDKNLDIALHAVGVASIIIPRTGKPSAARQAIERADDFVKAVKWRTGCEGRISALKREHGWRRTRLRGHT